MVSKDMVVSVKADDTLKHVGQKMKSSGHKILLVLSDGDEFDGIVVSADLLEKLRRRTNQNVVFKNYDCCVLIFIFSQNILMLITIMALLSLNEKGLAQIGAIPPDTTYNMINL
jgi:CBS-domain-containing membrane protein